MGQHVIVEKPVGYDFSYVVKAPTDPDYNPEIDSVAVRMRATLVKAGKWVGRFLFGPDLVMRQDGSFADMTACPTCGAYKTAPIGTRIVRVPHPNYVVRTQRPWEQAFALCPTCVSKEEIAENERRVQASPARRRTR